MSRDYFIAFDTHGSFSELAAVTTLGNLVRKGRCGTTIPALRTLLKQVPRPRHLTFEEGPLANWLYRNLKDVVDSVTVAEPRRNRLIASEGDKDDDVDAEKLAQLFRGGYIKAVHQTESLDGSVFKQLVAEYHRQVRRRVAQSLQITALLKQHGIVAPSKGFAKAEDRSRLLEQLPSHGLLIEMVTTLWTEFDAVVACENGWRKRLVQRAKKDDAVVRFEELPGLGWTRAATLRVYLDTPWRFRSEGVVAPPGHRFGTSSLRQWPGAVACAVAGESLVEEYDPWRGSVGDRTRRKPIRRPASEMDRAGPVREAGAAQRGAQFVGDAVGPMEKWHAVSPGVGGRELVRNRKECVVELA